MSDTSRDQYTSRRRRKDDHYSDSEDADPRRSRKRDKSPDVRSNGHPTWRQAEDESDRDHPQRFRRDRRDQDSDRKCDSRSPTRDRRYRERSRSRDRQPHRRRSRSPPAKRRRHSGSRSPPSEPRPSNIRSRGPLPSQNESFRGTKPGEVSTPDAPPIEKQKPNYKPTGLLAKEANTVAGTTTILKYHEPPEARKPSAKEAWRIYIFKQKDLLDTIYLHQRSAWLLGRDEKVTDYLLEHPSISKQHAVIQFRYTSSTNEFGDKMNRVKPYLIDLESANGTVLNGKKIGPSRFVELVDGDVVAFGKSEKEYVLMLPSANA